MNSSVSGKPKTARPPFDCQYLQEDAAQRVIRRLRRTVQSARRSGRRCGGGALRAVAEEVVAEQGQEDLILRLVLRVPFQDRPLVELDDQAAIIDERLADREAEDFQVAVRPPEIEEGVLGAVGDTGRAITLTGGGLFARGDEGDGAEREGRGEEQ